MTWADRELGCEELSGKKVGPKCRFLTVQFDYTMPTTKPQEEVILIMQYMLLIHNEADHVPTSELPQMMREYMTFTQDLVKAGKFKAGDRLESSTGARTVRVRNGKTVTTDGPFAETKEQLGGYYIVDAKDLDEATAIAARIPGARAGSVEVRAVATMPQR
jgi:hypothetical protein